MADILSLFVSNEVAIRFIKKGAKITYILLIANAVLCLSDLAEWYRFVDNIPFHTNKKHDFYNYSIWPVLYMLDILIIMGGSVCNYKGFNHLKDIDIADDEMIIIKAFKYFYYAYVLFLAGSFVLLIDRCYRFFI